MLHTFADLHSKFSKYRGDCEVPVHVCSSSPEEVRSEAECLRTDFNARLSQVIFNSMFCCYYSACMPLCFSQVGVAMGNKERELDEWLNFLSGFYG